MENDSDDLVVPKVIDSLESSLNYQKVASGSSEELSVKSGLQVESRSHHRVDQSDKSSRGQCVRHGSGSISDPDRQTFEHRT